MDFFNRMCGYLTPEPDFDNTTHAIWRFRIIESKYTCYEIDDIIQYTSKKFKKPFEHYDGTGGIEHYKYTDIQNVCSFLKELGVKYTFEKIDVDVLRNEMKKIVRKQSDEKVISRKIEMIIY